MPRWSYPQAIKRPQPERTISLSIPTLPAPPTQRLPLGAALRVGLGMVTPLKYYLRIQAHETGATIEGDTRPASEVWYFHFGSVMEIIVKGEDGRTPREQLIWWVQHVYPDITDDDWDVSLCPVAGELTTMIGYRLSTSRSP